MDRRIGRQGGWVGLIVILLALAIVAWLSKDALKQYGLLSGARQGRRSPPGSSAARRRRRSPILPAARRNAVVPGADRARARRRDTVRRAARSANEAGRRNRPGDGLPAPPKSRSPPGAPAQTGAPAVRDRSHRRAARGVRRRRRSVPVHDPARIDDRVRRQRQTGGDAHRARHRHVDGACARAAAARRPLQSRPARHRRDTRRPHSNRDRLLESARHHRPARGAVPSYPHPIIAREGWPFLAIAVAVALLLTLGQLVDSGRARVARRAFHPAVLPRSARAVPDAGRTRCCRPRTAAIVKVERAATRTSTATRSRSACS